MPLMTQAALIDKYGLRLSMEQVSEVLGISSSTLYSMMQKGELPFRTYKEGGRRFAPYDAIAEYLDQQAKTARYEVGG